jgi:hypothetical protein
MLQHVGIKNDLQLFHEFSGLMFFNGLDKCMLVKSLYGFPPRLRFMICEFFISLDHLKTISMIMGLHSVFYIDS